MSLFASFANDDEASGSLWGNDAGAGGLFSNPLQDLLDSGNFTLNDVLTQQTLIQEVRNLNESLVKYLKENVTSLVEIVVNEDSTNAVLDENTNSQETNVDPAVLAASASEISACDVSEINRRAGDGAEPEHSILSPNRRRPQRTGRWKLLQMHA